MKGLVWLRNDIRMDDNPSLKRAFEECDTSAAVVGAFAPNIAFSALRAE